MKKLCLLLVLIVFLSSLSADLFDGNRKGLLFGLGAGGSWIFFSSDASYATQRAVATEFKIGLGLSDNFELYYTNQAAWFKTGDSNERIITDVLSGIGMSVFVNKDQSKDPSWIPTPFISFGLGKSGLYEYLPDEEDDDYDNNSSNDSSEGIGFFLGFGNEFAKHNRVSVNCYFNVHTDEVNSLVVMLTYSLMAF